MKTSFDPILVVERCYDLVNSEREWVMGLVEALSPALDQGVGVSGSMWSMPSGSSQVSSVVDVSTHRALTALTPLIYETVGQSAPRYYTQVPYFGSAFQKWDDPVVERILQRCSSALQCELRDVIGLSVGDGVQSGVSLSAFAGRRVTFQRGLHKRMHQLALHLGAGLRLRSRLKAGWRGADGVLDARGRILYAGAEVKGVAQRTLLQAAAHAIVRARGALRHRSPGEALELWQALVGGRWTVVDWVDTDGKRLLVVHPNPVSSGDLRGLTAREREVAEFLVHGRSNSEIAYALGLGESTINRLTRNVLRKFGRCRRRELAALFGGNGLQSAALLEGAPTLLLNRAERATALWDQMSGAEREVVRLALQGASNSEIARSRGRAARTIANQLAVVYARLGVRGRSELAALLG